MDNCVVGKLFGWYYIAMIAMIHQGETQTSKSNNVKLVAQVPAYLRLTY